MVDARKHLGLLLLLTYSAACDAGSSSLLSEPGEGDGLTARAAGQTGDEGATPWRPPTGGGRSLCSDYRTPEVLESLEQDTELGFSAADILGFVAGSHETRVRWNARPVTEYYAVQVTPGDVDETLRLTIRHDGSSSRYRTREAFDAGAFDAGALELQCLGRLELDVTVELRSESGALDEQWSGLLTASDAAQAEVLLQAPTWRGRLPGQPDRDEGNYVNALEGSLDVVDGDDPGSKLAWVDIVLRVRTAAVDGSVNGWVQVGSGGAFVLPQSSDEQDGWIGVIGEGFYDRVWAAD